MKCHEVRHLTFQWFKHNGHVHVCVREEWKTIVSQLRMLQPLEVENIRCSGLYNCTTWTVSRRWRHQSIFGHNNSFLSELSVITTTRVFQLRLFEQEWDLSRLQQSSAQKQSETVCVYYSYCVHYMWVCAPTCQRSEDISYRLHVGSQDWTQTVSVTHTIQIHSCRITMTHK